MIMGKKGSRTGTLVKFVLLVLGVVVILTVQWDFMVFLPAHGGNGDDDGLKVGAFNVQVFGTTKAAKEEVMDVLGDVIRSYDIIAIQEIRDSTGTALPALLEEVNSDGSAYAYVASDRLGRTVSKEQYAYFYDTQTCWLIGTPQTYPEPEGDVFHREPYAAYFSSREGAFTAVLITVHTDPDEAEEEIDALAEVVPWAMEAFGGEEDVIVMGDFNADGVYFDEETYPSLRASGYTWLITNDMDTTTGPTDCTYDRIVITDSLLLDGYTGSKGVDRFDLTYGLDAGLTSAVSDHYPVYAVFAD
ncbi:hypothetical protein AZH53_05870 [Methanomicrobiaceae archaeon CYW5]|nr:hypothetical protein [Methanovulcanius yangii]